MTYEELQQIVSRQLESLDQYAEYEPVDGSDPSWLEAQVVIEMPAYCMATGEDRDSMLREFDDAFSVWPNQERAGWSCLGNDHHPRVASDSLDVLFARFFEEMHRVQALYASLPTECPELPTWPGRFNMESRAWWLQAFEKLPLSFDGPQWNGTEPVVWLPVWSPFRVMPYLLRVDYDTNRQAAFLNGDELGLGDRIFEGEPAEFVAEVYRWVADSRLKALEWKIPAAQPELLARWRDELFGTLRSELEDPALDWSQSEYALHAVFDIAMGERQDPGRFMKYAQDIVVSKGRPFDLFFAFEHYIQFHFEEPRMFDVLRRLGLW